MTFYSTHVRNPFVVENGFASSEIEASVPPKFSSVRDKLPSPIWEGHQNVIDCYWKAWELAFGNLCAPTAGSGFVSPFLDTAFNGCLFMWDSAFSLMYGRYGIRAFNFQRTLDNFYARQHPDGYICREINEKSGEDQFERFDPSSTGPNLLPWCEWEYFVNTGDRERLSAVFPCLLAYTQWFRKNRSWPDGSYWSSGWGCGMDNQPRLPAGCNEAFEHGHMSWIDTTCQQVLANRILIDMAKVLDREKDIADLKTENESLIRHINETMWNDDEKFYTDRFRDGSLSNLKSIGAYWALLADAAPPERKTSLIAHLEDVTKFNRPHRVPTLSADHPQYDPDGGYWRGAVWAPTTYMVLRGLTHTGNDHLGHDIGMNHLENVVSAFKKQGTLFENYAPESVEGKCKPDFVGWTGLPPIAVLFEYCFGIRPNLSKNLLLWDIRLLEEHGVHRYPFGQGGLVDLLCSKRNSPSESPAIRVIANEDMNLLVRCKGREKTLELTANEAFEGTLS